jgi:hypothetical protein
MSTIIKLQRIAMNCSELQHPLLPLPRVSHSHTHTNQHTHTHRPHRPHRPHPPPTHPSTNPSNPCFAARLMPSRLQPSGSVRRSVGRLAIMEQIRALLVPLLARVQDDGDIVLNNEASDRHLPQPTHNLRQATPNEHTPSSFCNTHTHTHKHKHKDTHTHTLTHTHTHTHTHSCTNAVCLIVLVGFARWRTQCGTQRMCRNGRVSLVGWGRFVFVRFLMSQIEGGLKGVVSSGIVGSLPWHCEEHLV